MHVEGECLGQFGGCGGSKSASARVCVLSHVSCVWLCVPMDYSPPSSSVFGILQARILEWVAMPSSRRSSRLRDWTCVSVSPSLTGRFFTANTTRGAQACLCSHLFLHWNQLVHPTHTGKVKWDVWKISFSTLLCTDSGKQRALWRLELPRGLSVAGQGCHLSRTSLLLCETSGPSSSLIILP